MEQAAGLLKENDHILEGKMSERFAAKHERQSDGLFWIHGPPAELQVCLMFQRGSRRARTLQKRPTAQRWKSDILNGRRGLSKRLDDSGMKIKKPGGDVGKYLLDRPYSLS